MAQHKFTLNKRAEDSYYRKQKEQSAFVAKTNHNEPHILKNTFGKERSAPDRSWASILERSEVGQRS